MKERTTGSQHSSKILLALSLVVLVLLVRINFTILPFTWPDEALFSSPALELAEGRPFSTRVLTGLIHGMDRATLWNGPLYMTLLSGVYHFTGESVSSGRTFSLVLGCFTIALFYLLTCRLTNQLIAGFATLALSLDPVFQRASNTIRMDILTLLLLLAAMYLALADSSGTDTTPASTGAAGRRRFLRVMMAGVAAGLAGTSHPFAVIAIPVLFILLFPEWKKLLMAGAGVILGFAPWGIYIIRNMDLFKEQFIPQLQRKESFLRMLTGGDTGGVLNVYFSQYGFSAGSWPAMVIGALLYAFVIALVALFIWRVFRSRDRHAVLSFLPTNVRVLLCFLAISGFALISSEGWYVVYGDVFLILSAAVVSHASLSPFAPGIDPDSGTQTRIALRMQAIAQSASSFVLPVVIGTMLILSSYFTVRHLILKTRITAATFTEATVSQTAECQTVYLRVRPDPYFAFREQRPEMRVLEFIPGKLRIRPDRMQDLIHTLDGVDCFLLDRNKSWEPLLTNYLHERAGKFQVHAIRTEFPLADVDLYKRKKHAD